LLLSCFIGIAQNPYNTKYSLEEGLPTSNVYSVLEDSLGYLWFATDVGVLKYDGYAFKHFNTDNGLGDNEIFKIFEDSKRRLWFLSLNGQLSYLQNNTFFSAKNNAFLKKASHQKMLIDIFEDNKHIKFLYRDGVILTIDLELTKYDYLDLNVASYSIWKNQNSLKALTMKSVRDVSTQEETLFDKNMISLNGHRFFTDGSKNYISTKGCVYEYINESFNKIIDLGNAEIIFMTKINGEFWIGTRKGLYIQRGDDFISYYENDVISSIIKDAESNIWITTLNNGIRFVTNMDVMLTDFYGENLKVYAIEKDVSNVLWIGSERGLHILQNNSSLQDIPISETSTYVKKIKKYEHSVYVIANNSIEVFNNQNHDVFSFTANDIFVNDSSYILASSVVFKFNSSKINAINNEFKKASVRALDLYTIFGKRTNIITKGFNNDILFGTSTGLFNYIDNNVEVIHSENEELDTSILDILVDKESNRLLIASNSKGIITLKDGLIKSHLTTIQGLNSNGCNVIKKVHDDTYFVGTNNGLNKIEFIGEDAKIYNYSSLLQNTNERINDVEVIDSMMYLATYRGLISFNYYKSIKNNVSPRLLIENVSVDNALKQDLLNLSYDTNDLTIRYTGISYSDFGNLTYEYKFLRDQNWTSTSNRQLNFKDLSEGDYTLQIRAKGRSNLFSPVKSIEFVIKPPFWKTVPFILLITALFFILAIIIIKNRISNLKSRFSTERKILKNEQDKMILEKQMVQLEQKAMRLQMNPHFIFNALNTIKGYYSGGNIKEANHYISKFSKLLRLILENDSHLISLDKEIEMLELYIKLIALRYQEIFDYKISISSNIIKEDLGIPPLLLQPLVENAIIHGLAPSVNKGNLQIDFSLKENKLICKIIDNGVGFNAKTKKSSNHESKALEISKERVTFLNNSKSEDNFQIKKLTNPSGTEVVIKLPQQNLWN